MSDVRPVIGFIGVGLMGHGMAKNLVTKVVPGITIRGFFAISVMAGFVNRFFALPKYLSQLRIISLQENWIGLMTKASFAIMCLALVVGASIILFSLFKARRLERLSTVGV